jgi:molybdenum cofactor cytidylyltransferase
VISVVVLAAGRSSRMGASKPLLPLGPTTVIERVVASISRAEVGDIVVVTGHMGDVVAHALAGLPVRRAHNAGYDSGMFSSVRTGVRALTDDVEAFFVLPVDYPLVRTQVLASLIDRFRAGDRGMLHPTCCGLRGHPPLLAGRYRETILRANDSDNLQSLLEQEGDVGLEVETDDPTILMDMDTAEDYRRIGRFAGRLDMTEATEAGARAVGAAGAAAAGAAGAAPAGAPPAGLTAEDALYLLSLLEAPEGVVRHCRAVAAVGEALAEALVPSVPGLDVDLVRTACLLHDLARTRAKHAAMAQRILTNLGLSRLGTVVGAHMVLPPEQLDTPLPTEAQLLYLADKLVIDDRIAGLEEKKDRALRGRADDPAALEGARARMMVAESIRTRVDSLLGRPLEEVLPREIRPSI